MKYVSLLMVAVIVGLSWFLMRPSDDLSADQHARLQQVMTEYLAVYLKESNPAASDIQDPQITTRIVESGRKMHASFKLSYTVPGDNGTTNKIAREGLFVLTSENGNDWTAKMERIDDSMVEFADNDALSISLADAKAAAKEDAKETKDETPVVEEKAH
jgi:hypothetical protein